MSHVDYRPYRGHYKILEESGSWSDRNRENRHYGDEVANGRKLSCHSVALISTECQYNLLASLERVDVHWESNCRCNRSSVVHSCQFRIGLYGMKRALLSGGKPSSGRSILEHQQHDGDIQSQLRLGFLPHRCQLVHDGYLTWNRAATLG